MSIYHKSLKLVQFDCEITLKQLRSCIFWKKTSIIMLFLDTLKVLWHLKCQSNPGGVSCNNIIEHLNFQQRSV